MNNKLPPGLVSNLQQVLSNRKGTEEPEKETEPPASSKKVEVEFDESKPIVFVTNADGIDSPGLTFLVQALVGQGLYNVFVCAPQSDKSHTGHSMTLGESVAVYSSEIDGAIAYEVSGTPADCVSLALSGALFSWSKPILVISGVHRGSSCGHKAVHSGAVASAREALFSGVPSMSISLNWKKDESQETDLKDAVSVCLPLINAAISDIKKGNFPKNCSLNVDVPTSPLKNKGFKSTTKSLWRSAPSWLAVSATRQPTAARFMSNQQSLGMQLAQLSRDASAAGAARRSSSQQQNVEVDSVGVSKKSDSNRTVKYFIQELVDKDLDDASEELDFRALENGYVAITPLSLSSSTDADAQTAASNWIASAVQEPQ
ncbi:Survival protein SurE-like phosphatase/nucleotidase [Heracleum sosnowskyi]|uniref:Survival protein SurE-like phosphatase/nucleotidase n=1 Tax=Heracleum sosnowskyi TaxID=360622 RepID=A0AAD8M6U4_9APIA|nr:Survival protein SurE-like phosphatase/nucleotidase [Heracleum sosnowskyi]